MAQSLGDLFVTVGADANDFDREMDGVTREMQAMAREVQRSTAPINRSFKEMGPNVTALRDRMKEWRNSSRADFAGFREDMAGVQLKFMDMADGMKTYSGTNAEFMGDLQKLGKEQKKITDNMMAQNERMKLGYIQGVAAMLARSGQSEKIAANFDRMGNPLYRVNNGLLAVTGSMEKMAKAGTPAVLALKMLGPTANMKELNDMNMMITQGLMRFQMVAMAAVVGAALFYSGLHKAAADSVPGYQEAMDAMGSAVREAFQPMVEVFAAIMIPVANFIRKIAELVIKFNEANPVLAKVIQGFLMLIPALILILSPLAIGIGLINGMAAAFSSVWLLIGPLVTGLGAMMGTVLLVAGAIAIIGVALWALWTKTDWFKGAVLGAWEAIKAATLMAWNWVLNNAIMPALTAIKAFITQIMGQVKTFWTQNGEQILAAGKNVWSVVSAVIKTAIGVILAIMQVAWPIVKSIIVSTWNAIKSVIQGAINIILGIIKVFSSLFTGNWKGVWQGAKQILTGIVQVIIGYLQLSFFGGIMKGVRAFAGPFKGAFTSAWNAVKSAFSSGVSGAVGFLKSGLNGAVSFVKGLGSTFYNAGKGLIDMMAKGISAAAGAVTKAVSSLAKKARDYLPFSPAKEGPLSDLDKLDFGGPISDSLVKAIPKVKGMMTDLVTLPSISSEYSGVAVDSAAAAMAAGPGISIGALHVREEADVEKIAVKLYKMQQSRMRATGGRN